MDAIALAAKALSFAGYLRSLCDPNMHRRLDAEITAHVLEEIPRLAQLIEEREAQIRASGCTPEEANIIAHQVYEAQKKTLDGDKRRRLSNVLVNGLSSPTWNKARMRLFVRLTAELEEEHINLLVELEESSRGQRRKFEETETEYWIDTVLPCGTPSRKPSQALSERFDLEDALTRELISLGLITELQRPRVLRDFPEDLYTKGPIYDVELDYETSLAPLGSALLHHLREPDGAGQ